MELKVWAIFRANPRARRKGKDTTISYNFIYEGINVGHKPLWVEIKFQGISAPTKSSPRLPLRPHASPGPPSPHQSNCSLDCLECFHCHFIHAAPRDASHALFAQLRCDCCEGISYRPFCLLKVQGRSCLDTCVSAKHFGFSENLAITLRCSCGVVSCYNSHTQDKQHGGVELRSFQTQGC